MITKPKILSDGAIALILDVAVNEKESMLASRRDVAQAQLDACCEYYEPVIKKLEETIAHLRRGYDTRSRTGWSQRGNVANVHLQHGEMTRRFEND